MFWRKRREEPVTVRDAEPPPWQSGTHAVTQPEDDAANDALDALGAVLRALARNAFDLGDLNAKSIEKKLEGWATHILVCGPVPGTEESGGARAPRRNFNAMVRAVTEHRKFEREYVSTTITELRSTLWSFVTTLTRSLGAEESTDTRLRERVERLKEAVTSDSYEALRAEASLTANVLADVVHEREERARRQAAELGKTLRSLREQLEEANREGALDPLTRIYNRKTLEEVLERSVGLSALAREPCCLLMIDVDHFKRVNDHYGHPAGDAVLKEVADALVRCFPRRGDVVARYGGEEFAVVLTGSTMEEAARLAEKPLHAMRALTVKHGAHAIQVTVSVGYAGVRTGELADAWIERADKALYAAKTGGRNRAVAAT
ncbi:MAG: diguanylate cyclase [Myxococcales bacterium]|nr:diguanylate cyclase [Myxococcales bacterium]